MNHKSPQQLVQSIVDAGFSQTDIAKSTGIPQPTISRILNGKHKDPRSSCVDRLRAFAADKVERAA